MSKKVYRTAIYARLSRDDGDKAESNSIVSQKAMCEEYIKKAGDLELVETFVDDGYSGVDFQRPGFMKMEQAVREKRIDAIVCKDLSRFSRNYIEGGRYLERIFPQLGLRFIAINDGYDTLTGNPQSDSFIIPFKNLINDTYCKDISVKIRTNLDVKRRKGEYVGAYAPYGYAKSADDKNRLVVDEYAGGIVRKIFSLYKDGMSICRIAEHLNELGVLSPMEYKRSLGIRFETAFRTGNTAKWSYRAVKRILMNEAYIGVLVQGKRGTPNYKVHIVQEREESEWIRVEDAHEALVSYEDFIAVQGMLKRDMRSVAEGSEENLFSGFLFCADCGQAMVRKVVPSGKKRYYYYVCSSAQRHEGCSPHSISVKEVEKAVGGAVRTQVSAVLDLAETLEYLDRMPSFSRKMLNYEAQIAGLEGEIERYQRMKLRLYEDLADGVIDKKEYADFREQYTALIEDKSTALERVRKEQKDAEACGEAQRAWVALFRQYENIEELTRRALMALVDKVYVYEKHVVEVLFKYGDEFCRMEEVVEQSAGVV